MRLLGPQYDLAAATLKRLREDAEATPTTPPGAA